MPLTCDVTRDTPRAPPRGVRADAAMYFFPATSAAAQDGDDADVFGNPVRRLVGPNASWWMEELACCLCGCLATGPMFIVIGMVFLVRARAANAFARSSRRGAGR